MLTGTSEKISEEVCQLATQHPGFLYFTAGLLYFYAILWQSLFNTYYSVVSLFMIKYRIHYKEISYVWLNNDYGKNYFRDILDQVFAYNEFYL